LFNGGISNEMSVTFKNPIKYGTATPRMRFNEVMNGYIIFGQLEPNTNKLSHVSNRCGGA
jgi:hypothetical protein